MGPFLLDNKNLSPGTLNRVFLRPVRLCFFENLSPGTLIRTGTAIRKTRVMDFGKIEPVFGGSNSISTKLWVRFLPEAYISAGFLGYAENHEL